MADNTINKKLFVVILISFSLFILISGCNKQKTHFECSDGSCIKVNGAGTDECTEDSDCYHAECSNGDCVKINSPGTDECTGDGQGVCYHKECNNKYCEKADGPGSDKCTDDDDCIVESKCEELNSIFTEAYVETESAKGQEEIEITPLTDNNIKISVPTKTGGDLDFYAFYSVDGGKEIALGKSIARQLITSAETKIPKNAQFIVSSGKYSHLLEVTGFDSTNSKVAFKNVGLGTSFKVAAADQVVNDGSFSLGEYEYYFTAYYDEQKIKVESLGTDEEGEIWTSSGAKLTISVPSETAGLVEFTENYQGPQDGGPSDTKKITVRITDAGTADTQKITTNKPNSNDENFEIIKWDSIQNHYEGYTRWGTHIVYEEPVGGQNPVTITYPKTEVGANVYITSGIVSTTGGTTTFEGDAFKISSSTDELNLYEYLSSESGTTELEKGPIEKITKEELNALADGSITNEKGTYDYNQEIILPEDAKVVHEIDIKQSNDPQLYLKFAANKPGYTYRLSFPTAIRSDIDSNNHFDDLDDKKISMLGKEFTIVETNNLSGEIKLMTGVVRDRMEEGDSKTYTINGVDYKVDVIIITDTEPSMVKFKVNGETTDAMQRGESFKLADGTEIAVKSLEINEEGDVVGDRVEFYLGAETIIFEDHDFETADWEGTLTVGGEEIKDVGVNIVGTFPDGGVAVNEIEVRWTPDENYYVPTGGKLSDQLDPYYKDQLFLRNMDFELTGLDMGTTGSTTTYTSCGDAKYDKRADFNNDRQIGPEDKTIFTENDGDKEWCTEQLEKTFDPCESINELPVFEDYPSFLIKDNQLDAIIVIGDNAPAEDAIAVADIALGLQYITDGENIINIDVGSPILASEVSDPEAQNMILVGRPTKYAGAESNQLIDNFELPDISSGQSLLKIAPNGDYYAVIVTGKDKSGPMEGATYLKDYNEYSDILKGREVLIGDRICTDSDGGKNYSVKGEITGELVAGPGSPSTDICIDDNQLRELFCNNEAEGNFIIYECPNGCENGACIEGESEVIKINGEYTVLNENFPNDVYSSTVYFYTGNLPNKKRVRTLLNFDLSGLEGKKIKKVELVIKKVNLTEQDEANAGKIIEIHKVTSSWRSETISWNNHPKFDTTVIDSQEITGNGEYTFSITTIMPSLIKHESGVLLKAEDEKTTKLKKFDEAYLNVWYTAEEEEKSCKDMDGNCRYIGECGSGETETDYECPFWSKCCMPEPECLDDDEICPDGCTAEDDNDCEPETPEIFDCGNAGPDNPDSETADQCLREKFDECSPANYSSSINLGPLGGLTTYYYEIIGPENGLCKMKTKYLANINPEWVGKEMICNYNNSKELTEANAEVWDSFNEDEELGDCEGQLYDLVKNLG